MGRLDANWKRGTILAIEDSPGDRELIRRALRTGGFAAELSIVCDGDEALEYVLRRGRYEDPASSPRADLILLDLNLPGTSGREVLELVKGDVRLRSTPIVIVTTSMRQRDVVDAYELGCNSYVVKPLEARGFIGALRNVCSYWLGVCLLPSDEKLGP